MSSEPGPARAFLGALLFLAGTFALASPAGAKVFLTVDEALELAFPGCEVERASAFLTDAELARARQLAGVSVDSALAYPYTATCKGALAGTAYFDTHRVRTLAETLMIVIDPEDRVVRIEVLTFNEPEEYLPRTIWYDQFKRQPLTPALELGRDIRAVTGASLTARSTADAVRRSLALHQVLAERAAGGAGDETGAKKEGGER